MGAADGIPSNRRSDSGFEPKAYAILVGKLVEIPHKIQADLLIIEGRTVAALDQIQNYPEIMVYAEVPQVQCNVSGAEFSWSLTCEEI